MFMFTVVFVNRKTIQPIIEELEADESLGQYDTDDFDVAFIPDEGIEDESETESDCADEEFPQMGLMNFFLINMMNSKSY